MVFGTHNLAAAPALLRRARTEGTVVEVLDGPQAGAAADQAPALAAVRDVPWAAWMTIQTGCDNSCAFCIVPQVRGPEVSRPMQDLVDEARELVARGVVEMTVLGQNVNSYGRDLTRRRPLFAELLRALGEVEGLERLRFTSPHPKDLRDETIAAMAEVPAVCEQLHLPLQAGSDRTLVAMRRGYRVERYLERLAAARAAIEDLAVTTDLIVGFPGETDEDFDDTLAVVAEAGFDSAYTFVFSPRPGTRAAADPSRFVPDEVVRDRFARLVEVVERAAVRRNEARVGRTEQVLVEGPSRKDATTLTARTRQGKPVHFAPRRARRRSGLLRRRDHHPRRAPPPARRAARGDRPPPTPHEDPDRRSMTERLALVGATASGKSRAAHAAALARGDVEIVSLDAMAVYRGMDLATAKPTPAERAQVRYHLVDVLDASEELSVAHFQSLFDEAVAGIGERGHVALLVGGSGLYHRAAVDGLSIPPTDPAVREALQHEAADRGLAALYAELAVADPIAAAGIEPRNERRIVRALEVLRATGRPFSSFGPGLSRYADADVTQLGIAFDAVRVDDAIARRFEGWLAAGLLDELRGLLAAPGGLSRTARQAAGYRQLLEHLEDGVALDVAVAGAIAATRRLARRQWRWFRRDPRIRWVKSADAATTALVAAR